MESRKVDMTKKMQYILNMRPPLNPNALFSEGTDNYRIPSEPVAGDEVTIRFRTQKNNVDEVYLVSGSLRQKMEVAYTCRGFDYYETKITVGEEIFRYHFEIIYGLSVCYFNNQGALPYIEERMDFEIYPGYSTPDWAKGAVMYQIFVDRFRNGDLTNDTV